MVKINLFFCALLLSIIGCGQPELNDKSRCTYPNFMNTREGELLFHYRDGSSGNGNEIYNIYNPNTRQWQRLLDTPLTDGQGLMNAYQTQPTLLSDNCYHVYWVWRDTPDCSTNHDLSYIKSPDLKNWFNAFGDPVKLPVTIDNKSVIVDPIPVKWETLPANRDQARAEPWPAASQFYLCKLKSNNQK